jgi:hypothetical protein
MTSDLIGQPQSTKSHCGTLEAASRSRRAACCFRRALSCRPTYALLNTAFGTSPPLGPGESRPAKLRLGGTLIPGDAQLAGHELYAPPKPSQYELMVMGQYNIVARLTITWEDVFKRKHAGIYDYIDVFGWYCVGLFEDTERDLEDLNDHARSGALASAGIPAQTE